MDQTFTIRTPLLTGHDVGREHWNGIVVLATPPLLSSSHLHRLLEHGLFSGQSTDQTMHVLLCWKAQRWPVTNWLYIQAFQ